MATRFQPTGDGEFMRLTKELYTLKYTDFVSMTEYLTIVKTLQERIAATDVVLTPDKQTILALSMTLPEHLQYLTKIWVLRIKDLGRRIPKDPGTGSEYLALEFLARRIKLLTLILLIPAMVDDAAITMVATPESSCQHHPIARQAPRSR